MKSLHLIILFVISGLIAHAQSGLPAALRPGASQSTPTKTPNTNLPDNPSDVIIEEPIQEPLNTTQPSNNNNPVINEEIPEEMTEDINEVKSPQQIREENRNAERIKKESTTYKDVNDPFRNEKERLGFNTFPIRQGSVMLGASTNVNFVREKVDTTTVGVEDVNLDENKWSLNGSLGVFVANNLAIGGRGGYTSIRRPFTMELNTVEYGIFARYYLFGRLFGGVGYDWVKEEIPVYHEFAPIVIDTEVVEAEVLTYEVGFAGFLSENIAFEPQVFWTDVRSSTAEKNYFKDSIGFRLGLGVYFRKNKSKNLR